MAVVIRVDAECCVFESLQVISPLRHVRDGWWLEMAYVAGQDLTIADIARGVNSQPNDYLNTREQHTVGVGEWCSRGCRAVAKGWSTRCCGGIRMVHEQGDIRRSEG
ncbi:hypothetical protein SUGI_0509430 [Cryptomeria japonica]|nr:hypothetical protein SUGI_0509430 [Cryptomeria japonica]